MNPTIFYSWQSDSPNKHNRNFIEDALAGALKQLKRGEILEPANRIDQGVEGTAGMPDIAATIFDKISAAEVAVFDVTPVGSTVNRQFFSWPLVRRAGKALPNPNVMIELGYAAKAIGWERVITVMNTAGGCAPEQLPFDIRHRRFPIQYSYGGGSKADQKERLVKEFCGAIIASLAASHGLIASTIAKLSSGCLSLIACGIGQREFFSSDSPHLTPTVDRLLDLGVIRSDASPERGQYAYYWTYLGKRICKVFHPDS